MQPMGGITQVPDCLQNPVSIDKTTPVKVNYHTGAVIGIPADRGMALQLAQSTPSTSLPFKKSVKPGQVRSVPGHPYSGSDNKTSRPAPSDKPLEMELQVRSKAVSECQRCHLDHSATQVLINLIKQGDTDKVKECINNNPLSLTIEDEKGNSVLHLAVLHGHDDLCRLLFNGARHLLQATNDNDERPLHIAAKGNQNNCLAFLLDNCSYTTLEKEMLAKDKSGSTPVHLAAQYGNITGLMAMLDYESIRCMYYGDFPLISFAIKNGHKDCVAFILSRIKSDSFLFQPYSLVRYAVQHGQLDCVKWFVQTYPDSFTSKRPDFLAVDSIILLAINSGQDKILKYLLEQPYFIDRLTKMEYADEFECKENGSCAKLIRAARQKMKLPFCPVQNFDQTLFQKTWQREAEKTAKNTMAETQALRKHLYSLSYLLDISLPETASSILPRVKALLSGLQKIGVYVRCAIQENTDEKGQFWAMGDATASVGLIKTLVSLGVKTIHVQLSPPDDSDFVTRQKFNSEERVKYIKKQRIALSKLAYLLPGTKLEPGIQEIYSKGTKIIISTCNFRRENKIDATITLSFLSPKIMYQHLGFAQESFINLTPYRFFVEKQSMYSDADTSEEKVNKINHNTKMPNCNVSPLHLPINAIIPDDDLQPQETEISTASVNSHAATLILAINQLCDLSANGKIQTAVVYGLHHSDLRHCKQTILTNWLSAIKLNHGQVTDALPVVVTTTVSAFGDDDINGKRALYKIAKTTGFTLIDFRDQQDRASLMAAGKGQLLLCLMPSLPRQSFNQLVQSSRFPVLSEGANLTTTLLQNGQPHLSLLPRGQTPVAQDMGGPLEALKALAFSCKLQMEMDGADILALDLLSRMVGKGQYKAALSFIERIKAIKFKSRAIDFVWADPQPSPLQLRSVTIMSLLQKGNKMGDIEKKALVAALDPSDKALAGYINSCLDKDSITTHHFRLQQMHVNKPFNNKV
ncbi:ankyrin repeat domain-containing protein, partial [Endozoicomonas sp. ONNA2]|uniref:ankyrin repeat domain-containing protein n=1 Tax=Endozoicomonas sp. ONNA2 TaxID=2828741 RepID=UPI002148BCAB